MYWMIGECEEDGYVQPPTSNGDGILSQSNILLYRYIVRHFFLTFYYRPQTKFAKVMFSQVSACPQGSVSGRGCACGGGAWEGACMAGGGHT